MKKIVGIIAAVAMAASVFALDISASLRFNGDLFNIDFADGAAPKLFNLEQPKGQKPHGQTGFNLSVSTEKAGATIEIGNGYGGTKALEYQDFTLWVQPIDQLKINFGKLDYAINKETLDYTGISGIAGSGYAFDLMPIEGLSFSFVMAPGFGNPWITVGKEVKNTAFYAKYSADFGTIGFAWIYDPTLKFEHNVLANLGMDERTAAEKTKNATPYMTIPGGNYNKFVLGYGNTFGDVTMFVDAAFGIAASDDFIDMLDSAAYDLIVDGFVKYAKDSFGISAYLKYTNYLWIGTLNDKGADVGFGDFNHLLLKAKATYQLDAVGIYLRVDVADVMIGDFEDLNMAIQPGVTFNIGAASFDIGVKVSNIGGDPVNLSVPMGVSIGF